MVQIKHKVYMAEYYSTTTTLEVKVKMRMVSIETEWKVNIDAKKKLNRRSKL